MFSVDTFVADCRAALSDEKAAQASMREILARAVSDPAAILAELGEPTQPSIAKLHHSDDLTIINVVWGPHMTVMPHNHEMWANIGVYAGREDNIYWRRTDTQDGAGIEAAGAQSLASKDVATLGSDLIHSVTNPVTKLTSAIHVYGGDFFAVERSEWDPEFHIEHRTSIRLQE